jgi:hypothetical protein
MENSARVAAYQSRKADNTKVWLLFLFLGWSYGSLGSMGKQVLFYLTAGGLGLWTLIRLFTLSGSIKAYNKKIAREVGLSADEMVMVGLI